MTDEELPDVLTVREIAERERVSVDAVLRWAVIGSLPAYKLGRLWRVRKADYLAFRQWSASSQATGGKAAARQRQEAAHEYLNSIGL